MADTRRMEATGLNFVSGIVESKWSCGWQEYNSRNDEGIDGIILMRRGHKNPHDTGGIVFVQIKCGSKGYRRDSDKFPEHVGVRLKKEYIMKHCVRWKTVPGPAVLVFVDDSGSGGMRAWWTDLKATETYALKERGILLIPKVQRFGHHTKGIFHRLCGAGPSDRQLKEIALSRGDTLLPKLGKQESLRNDAWNFYKNWRADISACKSPAVGQVLVNRVGWKHMTRRDRLPERIVQSWLILGAARRIVSECDTPLLLGRATKEVSAKGKIRIVDYLALRARVTFSHRHESIIQVVLKRARSFSGQFVDNQKIWFYSVHELRRGTGQIYR